MQTEYGMGEFVEVIFLIKSSIPFFPAILRQAVSCLCRVVSGIGVTLIQPVYYSSMFSRDKEYGYPDDFDRSVLQFDVIELESSLFLILRPGWFMCGFFYYLVIKSDLPTSLVLHWIIL